MNEKIYEYDEIIRCIPEKGGAYVIFPWNIREEFGRGRVKVHAEFDGQPYDGSIVNMGVKHEDGSIGIYCSFFILHRHYDCESAKTGQDCNHDPNSNLIHAKIIP